ncbi:MAG: type IV pilus modification protein PilV [Proteobacteria bacterium]|nr:type IV pilus modification protein PilV [Pseudomonadota bacterium]
MPDLIRRPHVAGFSLIEVLVTMVIVVIGLLGVLGLQTKATKSEFEAYQRGQALALVRDMQSRFVASRAFIKEYVSKGNLASSTDGSVYVGYDSAKPDPEDCTGKYSGAAAQYNLCEWGNLLKGSAAKENGNNVAAMIGARGCLIRIDPPEGNALADIFVVVVWQGTVPGTDPPAGSPAAQCASAVDYGTGLRRGLSLRVLVPSLTQDSTGGGPVYTE